MHLSQNLHIYYVQTSNSFLKTEKASETFSATINLQEVLLPGGGTGEYSAVQGGSFGIGHDSTLMEATALTVLVTSDAGVAPDFAEVGLETNGATLGLVFSFTGLWTLTFETPTALAQIDYQLLAGALAGNTAPTLTTLSFGASVGDPPVENVVVVGGAAVAAALRLGAQPEMDGRRMVVMVASTGERYLSTPMFSSSASLAPRRDGHL